MMNVPVNAVGRMLGLMYKVTSINGPSDAPLKKHKLNKYAIRVFSFFSLCGVVASMKKHAKLRMKFINGPRTIPRL